MAPFIPKTEGSTPEGLATVGDELKRKRPASRISAILAGSKNAELYAEGNALHSQTLSQEHIDNCIAEKLGIQDWVAPKTLQLVSSVGKDREVESSFENEPGSPPQKIMRLDPGRRIQSRNAHRLPKTSPKPCTDQRTDTPTLRSPFPLLASLVLEFQAAEGFRKEAAELRGEVQELERHLADARNDCDRYRSIAKENEVVIRQLEMALERADPTGDQGVSYVMESQFNNYPSSPTPLALDRGYLDCSSPNVKEEGYQSDAEPSSLDRYGIKAQYDVICAGAQS